MTSAASTPDAADSFWDNPFKIITSKVRELKAAWKEVDQTGLQHATQEHLRLALLKRAYYKEFTAERCLSAVLDRGTPAVLSVEKLPVITTSPPSSAKSFKQALTQDTSLLLPQNNHSQQQLDEAKAKLRSHEQRLQSQLKLLIESSESSASLYTMSHRRMQTTQNRPMPLGKHPEMAKPNPTYERLGKLYQGKRKQDPFA